MSIEVTVEYAHREWNSYDHVVHIRNYQQLQAKVAELTAEVERLKTECKEFAGYAKDGTVIAAQQQMKLASAQEEINLLKAAVSHEADVADSYKDQLAKAEQRVAEACTLLCMDAVTKSKSSLFRSGAIIVAGEIRDGEWRKFMKEM